MRLLRRVIALAVVLLVPCAGAAELSPETARFRSLTDVDGLSQMSALAIAQDQQGFLWIGTQVGLNRYDGAKFRTFIRQRNKPDSLSEHYISTLAADRDGGLWVGTISGLNRYEPTHENFEAFLPRASVENSLPHPKINALTFDRDGELWIASDGGLSHFRRASRDFVNYGAELADRRCQTLALDGADGFWVGTGSGLARFDPRAQRFAPVEGSGPLGKALRGSILALAVDRSGELWIGTKDAGLLRYSPTTGALAQWRHDDADPQSISHDRVYALLEDRDGRLWIGTEAGADLMLDRSGDAPRFVRLQHRAQLPASIGAGRVVSLMQDAAGDVWFGTWSGGASLLSPLRSRFLSFEADSVDPRAPDAAEVVNMTEAGADGLWLGTRRGLFKFDSSRYALRAIQTTTGMRTYAVAVDGDTLLLGTDQGVFRFDPRTERVQRVALPAEVGKPFVDFIIVEPERIWISTRDAELFVLDRALGKVTAHHTLDSRAHFLAPFDETSRVLGGDKGIYWFAADGSHVVRRLRAQADDPHGLQSDTVHYFARGRDGQQWFATAAGLHRLDALPDAPGGARFSVFMRGGSASANAIKSIIEDRRGRLWMSSNAGIARFDPATTQFTSYGSADGAIDRGYYAFVHAVTADGQFAFGGASGFTVFDPEHVGDLPPPPRPLLTELELDNRAIEPRGAGSPLVLPLHRTSRLVLPAGQGRSIGLAFSAPYFVAPEQLRFSYRLDGFNENWIETDAKRRQVTYTNLEPGEYLFRVRARTADAAWGAETARLELVVLPFWWQTGWARLAGVLALIGVVSAFFAARLRWAAQQRRLLGEQVAERTADIVKLGQVGQELTATLNFEQAAERVYRQVRARLDAHVFLIALYRRERGVVELEYLMEDDVRRAKIEYPIDEPTRPSVWCVRECRELAIGRREQLREYGALQVPAQSMESIIYLPLKIEQRVIGCLSVQSPRRDAYNLSHLEFLRALASYTAIALDNADAYRRLDQSMQQTREAMSSMHRTHLALEEAYGHIEHLSRTDALTGLGNRRSLDQKLPTLLDTVERDGRIRLAFYVLDVDRFKAINDEHGHTIGDLVLGSLGRLLRASFPEGTLVVRWGGEEFLAIEPVADEGHAMRNAERMRLAIAAHGIEIGARNKLRCTVSIGFACYPFDPGAPRRLGWERVVEIADTALYAAKRAGRNRCFGYRTTGPIDADFEARLRGGAEAIAQNTLLELLDARVVAAEAG